MTGLLARHRSGGEPGRTGPDDDEMSHKWMLTHGSREGKAAATQGRVIRDRVVSLGSAIGSGGRCRQGHSLRPRPSFDRHLTADASESVCTAEAVTCFEAGDLGFAIGGHDDGPLHSSVDPGFEQQGDVVNDNGLGVLASGLSCQSGLFARDVGVNDLLKAAQLGRVSKDDGAPARGD